ncbi:mannosyltransferase putative-domain-containing protein [Hyaloraphidium curvatum]|nr:mannosyltransferase putative-domain-containing protein [Hyaloraphidium curvatum]
MPSLPHRRRRLLSARTGVLVCLLLAFVLLAWLGERAREARWRGEVDRRAHEWRDFVKTVPPYTSHLYPTKRGIVYTASRADLPLCIVSIIMLRTLGCVLPIEVVHFRGEVGDRERGWVSRIPGGNVVLREVEGMVGELGKRYWEGVGRANGSAAAPAPAPDGPIWFPHLPVKWDRNPRGTNPGRNYQLKAAAILFSSFEDVLYMDSDNFPVMDPSFLFEHASFREGTVELDAAGGKRQKAPVSAVFWPDYRPIDRDNAIFRTLGLPRTSRARAEKSQEAGQLLISKPRSWKALNLAVYMASDSSLPMRGGRPYYYYLLHGDKDTFRFAWRATGTGYYSVGTEGRAYVLPAGDLIDEVEHDLFGGLFSSRRPTSGPNTTLIASDGAEVLVPELARGFCGHTMVQAHPSAPSIPLFFHTNEVKYHVTGPQSSLAALSARLHPSGRRWTFYQRYAYRDPRTGLVSAQIPRELLARTRDRDTHWLRGLPGWSCRALQPDPEAGLEVETVRVDDKEGGVNDVWRKGVQGMLEACGGEEEVGIVGRGKGRREREEEDRGGTGMRTRRWGWSRWVLGDGV